MALDCYNGVFCHWLNQIIIVAEAIAICISIYQSSVISLYHFTNPSNRLVPMMLLKLPIMLCSNAPELCLY